MLKRDSQWKCHNFEKIFPANSQDVMTWVSLDEIMSPWSVLNSLSHSQTYYSKVPPQHPPTFLVPPKTLRRMLWYLICISVFTIYVTYFLLTIVRRLDKGFKFLTHMTHLFKCEHEFCWVDASIFVIFDFFFVLFCFIS